MTDKQPPELPLFHPTELEAFDKYLANHSDLSMVSGFDLGGLPISVIETSEGNKDSEVIYGADGVVMFSTMPVFISAPPGVLAAMLHSFVQNKKICYIGHDTYSVNGEPTTHVPSDSREWYYPTQEQEYVSLCAEIKQSFEEPLDEGLVYDFLDTCFADPVGMTIRTAHYAKDLKKRVAIIGAVEHEQIFLDAGLPYTCMEDDGNVPELDSLPFFDMCLIIHTNTELEDSIYNRLIKELKLKACVESTSLVIYMNYPEEEETNPL